MSFIKIYPLEEAATLRDADFGQGQPARCNAVRQFSAIELYLNIHEIAAFEECPLYLICEAETDALVNGIRLRLRNGGMWVLPDDAENEEERFVALLARAGRGEVVEMPYSPYLLELERKKQI